MSTVAVIAILVAAGEGRNPATQALLAAAGEVLGNATRIRVFEATPPSDDAALDVETEVDAYAVVTLTWQDEDRLRARTRVHVARTDRWTDRQLTFATVDTVAERGRALGFAIASMLPEEARVRRAPAAPERGPPAAAAGRNAVGLYAVGATDKGGGKGGSLEGMSFVTGPLALRGAVAARYDSFAGMDLTAADLVMSLAAGLAWWPLVPAEGAPVGVGLRADALLIRHQVYGNSGSGGWFLPGADLVGELALRVGGGVELAVGLGAELAFGKIDVKLGPEPEGTAPDVPPAATLLRLRALGEAGVRIRF